MARNCSYYYCNCWDYAKVYYQICNNFSAVKLFEEEKYKTGKNCASYCIFCNIVIRTIFYLLISLNFINPFPSIEPSEQNTYVVEYSQHNLQQKKSMPLLIETRCLLAKWCGELRLLRISFSTSVFICFVLTLFAC